ncbi:MAG: DNA polymerase III subunit delta [Deltaproteobacteria bacterium]|nr:MAG: DNA polymerase III subunit delta [Deltaproteobacteria bacterium]
MITAILGEEYFLVKKALTKLLDERCPKAARDFNLDVYEASELDIKKLAAALGTLPMMAERRCVLIKNAHELRKSDMDSLEPLVAQVPETTDLIFVGLKADNRFGFWKNLLKVAKVMEFKPLTPYEVPKWLIEQSKQEGYQLSLDAAELIEAGVGTDLMSLQSTLEKLYHYVYPEKKILPKDVEACVTTFSWNTVFELTDAVAKK